ncbi:MAG: RNA polymerase sigma-70 factor [Chitinophagaceae bacterium]|nr:RNA polymerase sigma-70 factor [Chitinophagaceae bacterium]
MKTIAALQRSDQSVFEQVFRQYHEAIYFYVLGKTASPYIAEEVVQVTFVKLWQTRASLSCQYQLSTQLFRIARTTMIDMLRKEKNVRRHATVINLPDGHKNDVWEKIEEKELLRAVDHAMSHMPDVRRKVFAMSRFQGKSYSEIATELTLSLKTIESHMTAALKQLRQLLGACLFFIL